MEITTTYDKETTQMLNAIKKTIISIEKQRREELKKLYSQAIPQQKDIYAIQRKYEEQKARYLSLQSKILSCSLPKYTIKVEKGEEELLTQLLKNHKIE